MPQINEAGLDLIKSFEGCELTAYQDPVGVWTIGYGHTGGVERGQKITQAQAEALLRADLAHFEQGVNSFVSHAATPNEFAAMVSFAFNLGLGSLKMSTLLKLFNSGDIVGAAAQFPLWSNAGGQWMAGLYRRRVAEQKLFLTP